MARNQPVAHELAALLGAAGIDARVTGGGVHWQVEVGPAASRGLLVHCFWYERALSGLLLGMNPANARSRLRTTRRPYEGPEYLVVLREGDRRAAEGRTRSAAEAVACARAWLTGVPLGALEAEVPFIEAERRALRAIAERLAPRLRWDLDAAPSNELWAYGEGRSCKMMVGEDGVSCAFLLGQAQVAHGADLDDVPAAVGAWLVSRLTPGALAARVPGVELERYAEVLKSDPARWHWLHLRDRIADPDDILAPLRELLQVLAESPVATRFFTFSSLDSLCFSASSHYPWVNHGLPVVAPAANGLYRIKGRQCGLREAVRMIEDSLAASPLRPFFGSEPHHTLPLLSEHLAQQGSALRPRLVQRGAWYHLIVADATGTRRCSVSEQAVEFMDATGRLSVSWPSLDVATQAIRRFCEGGASLDELASDPRAQDVSRRR